MHDANTEHLSDGGLNRVVEAQDPLEEMPEIGVEMQPKTSFVDRVRNKVFGDKGVVKRMIAKKSDIKIRRTFTGEWVTGKVTKYREHSNSVLVEWESDGKERYKEVKLDEFMRWQRGEVGENADTQGF